MCGLIVACSTSLIIVMAACAWYISAALRCHSECLTHDLDKLGNDIEAGLSNSAGQPLGK